MAVIKCKMCGGDVELAPDKTFGTCEYCGSTMTFPKIDDEQRAAAFNRGNHFRRIGEFDKALAVYERIVREDENDAEAHWCCALCRFGIEYVEDPATLEWLPTCHRASFDSFLEDVDYLAALEHSDGLTRRQYQKDAAKIAEVQRGILATSQNAEPYDVFICYKESDENGRRTVDSTLAQDIYYQLTEQGRKVFFARITLEDVVGTQYEPYIFAALNSAKVMIVVGTKPEYLNAVWVKNEWSRFLAMMKKDHHKLLLPCYRDMDPYDLPEQLSVLQSYDMGKIGFIQDLIRGVAKVLDAQQKPVAVKETVVVNQAAPATNISPLLKRAFMFLEDGDFDRADEFCEQVLNLDPECAMAYLGKLMADLQVNQQEHLKDQAEPFDTNGNYQKAVRFADAELRATITGYIDHIVNRNLDALYQKACGAMDAAKTEQAFQQASALFAQVKKYKDSAALMEKCLKEGENARLEEIYRIAKNTIDNARTEVEYLEAAKMLSKIGAYKDSEALKKHCHEKAQETKKNAAIALARSQMKQGTLIGYQTARFTLKAISGWQDADELMAQCEKQIGRILKERAENAAIKKQKIKIFAVVISVAVVVLGILFAVIIPAVNYSNAKALISNEKYGEAAIAFGKLGDYRNAKNLSYALWEKIADRDAISMGITHTVGLEADGTVVATGENDEGQCNVGSWRNIIAISAGGYHTVGLRIDGTVEAVGYDISGQCRVSEWENIVAINAGQSHTVGLKADGTVVAVGGNGYGQCDVNEWRDTIAISAGEHHTVGLKADGTVVAVGSNHYGQCNVETWRNIVAVSAYGKITIGLKENGTVLAAGLNPNDKYDFSSWKEIVAISVGQSHIVGLKANGTAVAEGNNDGGQCVVGGWKNIVAIHAGNNNTVGIKTDGTVVAIGKNKYGQCNVSGWTNIKLPNK